MKTHGDDWRKDKRPRSYRLSRTDSDGSASWFEFSDDRYLTVHEALGTLGEMTVDDPHWSFEEGRACVTCGEVGPISCGEGAEEYRQSWGLHPEELVWFSDK
jgi:hypothetical protein